MARPIRHRRRTADAVIDQPRVQHNRCAAIGAIDRDAPTEQSIGLRPPEPAQRHGKRNDRPADDQGTLRRHGRPAGAFEHYLP